MRINLFRFRAGTQHPAGRSCEEGSALVELALSLPMLSIILLGAAEFARIAYAAIEVTNAAHSAAVYAASSQAAVADTTGITNAANSDSPNLVGGNAISVSTPTTSCTCSDTTYTPSSCTDNSTCQNHHASMITTVTVKTSTTYSPAITIPGFNPTLTLKGQSTETVSNQ